MPYILALDQGTTSSRAIVYDETGRKIAHASRPVRQIYPRPGWVEHDPLELYESQLEAAAEAVRLSGADKIAALGIANQRETAVIWNRHTGEPIHNAVVWQCRRTADICKRLERDGHTRLIREKTGLLPDAYFSGAKFQWLLGNVSGAREAAGRGELLCGTVDTWLIWKLTGGKVHITDTTNASRTMLFNIHTLSWDRELLELLNIPEDMLPQARGSPEMYGTANIGGMEIPIAAAIGDQQAALYGQGCVTAGQAKCTYGTGCFLLQHTGGTPVAARNLLTTVALTAKGRTAYALEGSVFIGGALIQWLRDELGLIQTAPECDVLAQTVPDSGGAYIVPAFTGLGTPHWDADARGLIAGLTRGVTKAHICRAALDAVAYQVYDVLNCMSGESGIPLTVLRADGGAAASEPLMQFQADLCGVPVTRPHDTETTALGAAALAGESAGVWSGNKLTHGETVFNPRPGDRTDALALWRKAVEKSKGWNVL